MLYNTAYGFILKIWLNTTQMRTSASFTNSDLNLNIVAAWFMPQL